MRQVPVEAAAATARIRPLGGDPPPNPALADAFERLFEELRAARHQAVSQHAIDAEAVVLAAGLPVLHTLHLGPARGRYLDAVIASNGRFAAVSEFVRAAWTAAGRRAVGLIRNGVPDRPPAPGQVRRVALLAGRVSPEKGTADGIRLARAAGLDPLVIGAAYDLDYWRREVRIQVRPVPRADLRRMMAVAAVCLQPVRWDEPFGLVAAEAQLAGCPVVGYRRGALPEVVEEGVSGYLVEPGDEAALVAAIGRSLELDRGRVRASAVARLGFERVLNEYERALAEVARVAA